MPVRLLLSSLAVLCHVIAKLQRAHRQVRQAFVKRGKTDAFEVGVLPRFRGICLLYTLDLSLQIWLVGVVMFVLPQIGWKCGARFLSRPSSTAPSPPPAKKNPNICNTAMKMAFVGVLREQLSEREYFKQKGCFKCVKWGSYFSLHVLLLCAKSWCI